MFIKQFVMIALIMYSSAQSIACLNLIYLLGILHLYIGGQHCGGRNMGGAFRETNDYQQITGISSSYDLRESQHELDLIVWFEFVSNNLTMLLFLTQCHYNHNAISGKKKRRQNFPEKDVGVLVMAVECNTSLIQSKL